MPSRSPLHSDQHRDSDVFKFLLASIHTLWNPDLIAKADFQWERHADRLAYSFRAFNFLNEPGPYP